MQYFLLGSLIQNVGYLFELTAPTVEAAMVAVKMQYMGSVAVPISYCYFMFSYCFEKAPLKILNLLKIADIFVLGLVFTCDLHTFYYKGQKYVLLSKIGFDNNESLRTVDSCRLNAPVTSRYHKIYPIVTKRK